MNKLNLVFLEYNVFHALVYNHAQENLRGNKKLQLLRGWNVSWVSSLKSHQRIISRRISIKLYKPFHLESFHLICDADASE